MKRQKPALVVKAQLPQNAHLQLPEDTPVLTISRHLPTRIGVRHALEWRRVTLFEYRKSHGNAAASRCWIELQGQPLDAALLKLADLGDWLEGVLTPDVYQEWSRRTPTSCH